VNFRASRDTRASLTSKQGERGSATAWPSLERVRDDCDRRVKPREWRAPRPAFNPL